MNVVKLFKMMNGLIKQTNLKMNQAKLIKLTTHLLASFQRIVLLAVFVAPYIVPAVVYAAITPAKLIYNPSMSPEQNFSTLPPACAVQISKFCERSGPYAIDCTLLSTNNRPLNLRAGICNFKYFSTQANPPQYYENVLGVDLYADCPAYSTRIGGGYETLCDDGCVAPEVSVVVNGVPTCAIAPLATKDPPGGSCPATKNPISIAYGNKFQTENDYVSTNIVPLSFERTYSSTSAVNLDNQGMQWRNGLGRSIESINSYAFIYRASGKMYMFNSLVGVWKSDADITDTLVELKDVNGTRTGWTYSTNSSGEVESYDANGKLLSIINRAGLMQTMTYSCNALSANCPVVTPSTTTTLAGLLIRVANPFGRKIDFTYDSSYRIKTMTNPAGGVYTYTYSTDGNKNLSSVTYPDSKVKTYHYGEAAYVSATPNAGVSNASLLTGITDENGIRYASYWYDAQGRAYKEELAPNLALNIEKNELVYNTNASGNPTSTVVTDPRGSTRTYNFTTILGVVKSTGQSQPAGSGCAVSAAALTYDVNGNIASRTDFKGNKTTYVYDMARNLETSRTEGLTAANAVTPATRTITSSWHPTWHLPLVVTEYTGGTTNLSNGSGAPTGTALRSTTNVYDSKGNLTSFTEADPVRALSRTTTTTYTYSTAVPGLVLTKVIDGPRTDVNDISTYNYYPHDATCTPSSATPIIDPVTNTSPLNLGCRGQLQSITNALNQTTTYDRYNHHGQVEQMTDANGLITSSTYDLRQRPLSRTADTETTTLVYDNVGQVTQLTLPDASQLNYTYDAAHRLTDVQDSLGNKVHYTLDTEGNRTNETTTDPTNVLTKTLTRSYDALNRLQQVTGVE